MLRGTFFLLRFSLVNFFTRRSQLVGPVSTGDGESVPVHPGRHPIFHRKRARDTQPTSANLTNKLTNCLLAINFSFQPFVFPSLTFICAGVQRLRFGSGADVSFSSLPFLLPFAFGDVCQQHINAATLFFDYPRCDFALAVGGIRGCRARKTFVIFRWGRNSLAGLFFSRMQWTCSKC